jgi:hypothetical protein
MERLPWFRRRLGASLGSIPVPIPQGVRREIKFETLHLPKKHPRKAKKVDKSVKNERSRFFKREKSNSFEGLAVLECRKSEMSDSLIGR